MDNLTTYLFILPIVVSILTLIFGIFLIIQKISCDSDIIIKDVANLKMGNDSPKVNENAVRMLGQQIANSAFYVQMSEDSSKDGE
jgi:hypothetical protein